MEVVQTVLLLFTMASRRRTIHSGKRKLNVFQPEVPKAESSRSKLFKFDYEQFSIDQDLQQLFSSICEKSKDRLPNIVNYGLLLSTMVTNLGYITFQRLVSAIQHVPKIFPNANTLISKIVNVDSDCLPLSVTEIYIPLIRKLQIGSDFNCISDSVLWKCHSKYKEPFHLFLVPPVTTCIECMGTLYSYNVSLVSVFTLQGPFPAQKLTLRCKKGCGSSYSIDTYCCSGITRFYDFPTKWISASNKVFISDTVHELMCESGNHAFVSHHAFSEIYTSVFSKSKNGEYYAEMIKNHNKNNAKDTAYESAFSEHIREKKQHKDDGKEKNNF